MFQTNEQKEAERLMEIMSNTDAVLIAGGEGTVHEVLCMIIIFKNSSTVTF